MGQTPMEEVVKFILYEKKIRLFSLFFKVKIYWNGTILISFLIDFNHDDHIEF